MRAQSCIQNYINGNLSDAKEQAKKFSHIVLTNAAIHAGMSREKAQATAIYLKSPSNETFQAACDVDEDYRASDSPNPDVALG